MNSISAFLWFAGGLAAGLALSATCSGPASTAVDAATATAHIARTGTGAQQTDPMVEAINVDSAPERNLVVSPDQEPSADSFSDWLNSEFLGAGSAEGRSLRDALNYLQDSGFNPERKKLSPQAMAELRAMIEHHNSQLDAMESEEAKTSLDFARKKIAAGNFVYLEPGQVMPSGTPNANRHLILGRDGEIRGTEVAPGESAAVDAMQADQEYYFQLVIADIKAFIKAH